VLGGVQVVPPRLLRAYGASYLDTTCAPAVTWQLRKRTKARSAHSMCPRFQGTDPVRDDDPVTPHVNHRVMARLIPSARLHTVKGGIWSYSIARMKPGR
jgi:hypothetical protein